MNYAVIETGGKQYKITQGETLDIDRLDVEKGAALTFDKVLLVVSDTGLELGSPYVANAMVTATVVDNIKGEKVRAARFRAKSHYHRVSGFRPQHTRIAIGEIQMGAKKEKVAKKVKSE